MITQWQQHFLKDTEQYEHLLSQLPLKGRTVVDLGMGHGEITQLVLQHDVAKVLGIEIDPSLPDVNDPRLEIIIGSFTQAVIEQKIPFNAALVSNPPYKLLPDVFALLGRRQLFDVVLMVPARCGILPGFKLAFSLDGSAFVPDSKGQHLVLTRGWSFLSERS